MLALSPRRRSARDLVSQSESGGLGRVSHCRAPSVGRRSSPAYLIPVPCSCLMPGPCLSDVNAMFLTEMFSLPGLRICLFFPTPPCTCAHNNNGNSQLATTYQYRILYTSSPVTVGLDDPHLISKEVKLGQVKGLTRPHSRFKLPGRSP